MEKEISRIAGNGWLKKCEQYYQTVGAANLGGCKQKSIRIPRSI